MLTINITKWGTKKKVVYNTPQRPNITYFHSGIFMATLNTACRWSKLSAKKKHTVHFQGCYFLGDAQVVGYGRLKKIVQGKDTLNKNQSLPCRHWCCGLMFFLHWFLRFLPLLVFHDSGKLAIPHDNMFLILHILHLVLFKLLQRQGELGISGRSDLPFVWNGFVAIYFRPSVSKSCPPRAATMQQGLRRYWW